MRRLLLALLLLATPVSAKPLGAYYALDDCGTLPSWLTYTTLVEDPASYPVAAACSRATGLRYVFLMTSTRVVETRAALEAAGVWPYVEAVAFGEEWYESWKAGLIPIPGLDASRLDDWPIAIPRIQAWLGRRHADLHAVWGKPVLWVTTFVNTNPAYGPGWYQPVPPGTDLVGLDPYPTRVDGWATEVEPFYAHALTTTTLPLVLIPKWFTVPGVPPWDVDPQYTDLYDTARWVASPRVVGVLGFLWQAQPWTPGLRGLRDFPGLQLEIARLVAWGNPE